MLDEECEFFISQQTNADVYLLLKNTVGLPSGAVQLLIIQLLNYT